MTLNELDVQIDIEITAEQMRTYEEIIISTAQGRIAYTLTPQTQLNKMYRFKGKGLRRIGCNVADEVGDFYVKFISNDDNKSNEIPLDVNNIRFSHIDTSNMGAFFNFVVSMDNYKLLDTITENYNMIKGNCKYAPRLGANGCLEFATTILLHLYIILDLKKERNGYSDYSYDVLMKSLSKVSLAIYTAFMGGTPTEFSNITDTFSDNTTVLVPKEFSVVYLYLRDNFAESIKRMEFNAGNKLSTECIRNEYNKILTNAHGDIHKITNFVTSKGLYTPLQYI